MESIKVFVIVFCTCAVMIGGMKLLLGGVLEDSGKYILALVLIVTTAGALTDINLSFNEQKPEVTESAENTAEEMISYQAEFLIKELFENNDITYKKIKVKTNKSKEGGIVISEVIIYEPDPASKAVSLIESNQIAQKVTVK